MYGPLLRRHNLLLVDQRGTGRSAALDCPDLQNLMIAYSVAAGRCGRGLGDRSDDYTSARSADDLAAVIRRLDLGKVDMYGDSYGTFFVQVFAGRHGDQLRSIVVDSTYPAYGETGWYPTQGPAMRSSFVKACRRSPACRGHGSWRWPRCGGSCIRSAGTPWHGISHDGDGRRMRVMVNAGDAGTTVATARRTARTPTVTSPPRSARRCAGTAAPLLSLVAEAEGGGTNAGPVRAYSEGLDAAVACHDYPQVYDMGAPPKHPDASVPAAALTRRTATHPRTYGPFTVREYARSDWQYLDWCTRWPAAPRTTRRDRRARAAGTTPRADPGAQRRARLDHDPGRGGDGGPPVPASKQITSPNSFHVTAVGDTDDCAVRILRRFVRTPSHWPRHGCAAEGAAGTRDGHLPAHPPRCSGRLGARVAAGSPGRAAAAATVADLSTAGGTTTPGTGRAARRHVDLHRRPHHGLPPARRTPHA